MALTGGIDVSLWQRALPRDAGRFVFVRGTYGVHLDPRAERHVQAARARGLHVGLYAFGVHQSPDGSLVPVPAQADAILRLAERLRIGRVALDWERDGSRPQMSRAAAAAFIDRVETRRGECGLYASAWQFADLGQTWDWIAKWGSSPPIWDGWEVWQWRGDPLDRNYFAGSEEAMARWFLRSAPQLPPAPRPDPRPIDESPLEDDPMLNLAPSQTHRDVTILAGTILRVAPRASAQRQTRVEDETALGYIGRGYGRAAGWLAVNNGGRAVYVPIDRVRQRAPGQPETIANVRVVRE